MVQDLLQNPLANRILHFLCGTAQQNRKRICRPVNGGTVLRFQLRQKTQLTAHRFIESGTKRRRFPVSRLQNRREPSVLQSMKPVMIGNAVPQLPVRQNHTLVRRQFHGGILFQKLSGVNGMHHTALAGGCSLFPL